MAAIVELPDVSKVLDAIEAGLTEENRALIASSLTQRAFTLGVATALNKIYSDPESEQVIGKYMLKTLAATMWK
jgi:hypothetical protein